MVMKKKKMLQRNMTFYIKVGNISLRKGLGKTRSDIKLERWGWGGWLWHANMYMSIIRQSNWSKYLFQRWFSGPASDFIRFQCKILSYLLKAWNIIWGNKTRTFRIVTLFWWLGTVIQSIEVWKENYTLGKNNRVKE